MGIPINVWIHPYTIARDHLPDEPTLAIRIFDPGEIRQKENVNVPLLDSENWVGEIHSCFADYDPWIYEQNGQTKIAEELRLSPLSFKKEQARKIINEFDVLFFGPNKVSALMLHCNAGLSRSPAMAKALCEIFGLTPNWIGNRKSMMDKDHLGNRWVYNTMLEAAED